MTGERKGRRGADSAPEVGAALLKEQPPPPAELRDP